MTVVQRFVQSCDETLCGCFGSLQRSYKILSNDVTFEGRPLCNLTWCTVLCKSDIQTKLETVIAKALNIHVVFLVSLHLHTNLHFEDQIKIAKLMPHSIYKPVFTIRCKYACAYS